MAPTTSCRTSVGVAVLDGFLYAVGGQDGVQCLNHVERYDPKENKWSKVNEIPKLEKKHHIFQVFADKRNKKKTFH